jgi:DNA repair protein RecN (Recombination protein N)
LYDSLEKSVSDSDEFTEKIANLEKELVKLESKVSTGANKLHEARVKSKLGIEKEMQALLSDLKLPDTVFEFKLIKSVQFSGTGNTQIELLFSPNKGMNPVPIENAASGGELSRVMLALQKLISVKKQMPTIFFDEIDTGVSGDVAQKIGNLLRSMGGNMQLFAISHLPQVAAKASNQFKVEKGNDGVSTQTKIRELTQNERIEEIARLMSGESINEAAISNAKALMN